MDASEFQVRKWVVDFSESNQDLELSALKHNSASPEPLSNTDEIKKKLDAKRKANTDIRYKTSPYTNTNKDLNPSVGEDFTGKPIGPAGIPNDNTIAVSNDGIIISAINTTVTILDSTGNVLKFRSLAGIVAGQLGILDRFYDPKVLYDPIADRFILVFLEGSTSDDTRIIVGFTQTNDPTGNWNFYQINGKPLGGNTWSDYPIIAHNGVDLYITVNSLLDNTSWQEGFLQSFIWQINKEDGYNGESLTQNLFYDIEYKNQPVWSICPVQPAEALNQEDMYFLSVRPDAEMNDTIFLHYINESSNSGNGQHSLDVLRSGLAYGVPPSALQPTEGFLLQTNDTRVLSATLYENSIHFVQSTLIPEPLSSGIYHGIISELDGARNVTAQRLNHPDYDLAYPSITFTGGEPQDKRPMMITFSHSGAQDYPGTSLVFYNGLSSLESIYSEINVIKEGDSIINTFVADSLERWGDYTDIQRQYNRAGIVWLCGSYGDSTGKNNVWIAKVDVNDELELVQSILTYPNPASSSVQVAANFTEDQTVNVFLTDISGKRVKELRNQQVRAGSAAFLVHVNDLATGMYVLSIQAENGDVIHSQKVIIE